MKIISSINWKVFLISLVAQLIISFLLNVGLRSPKALDFLMVPKIDIQQAGLQSPLPQKFDVIKTIMPKLQQKPSDFQLKKESSLIQTTYAAGDYEQATSYVVIDLDSGEVLGEKEMSKRVPIASLTKIMTAAVALDLASPDEQFTVSQRAAQTEPTKIGVVPGQKMTLSELLNALLMTSANDSAQVIKEGIDQKYGKDGLFVQAMNEKAKFLHLENTSFTNPQGFDDPKNFSSAEDLAILAHYALNNYPQISEIAKKDYEQLPDNEYHKGFDLYNWNGLIGVYPGAYGLKIGNTDEAGKTIVATAQRDDKKIAAVVLGAPGVLQRDLWAAQILDAGFEKLGLDPANVTENQLQAKYSTWRYW